MVSPNGGGCSIATSGALAMRLTPRGFSGTPASVARTIAARTPAPPASTMSIAIRLRIPDIASTALLLFGVLGLVAVLVFFDPLLFLISVATTVILAVSAALAVFGISLRSPPLLRRRQHHSLLRRWQHVGRARRRAHRRRRRLLLSGGFRGLRGGRRGAEPKWRGR